MDPKNYFSFTKELSSNAIISVLLPFREGCKEKSFYSLLTHPPVQSLKTYFLGGKIPCLFGGPTHPLNENISICYWLRQKLFTIYAAAAAEPQ